MSKEAVLETVVMSYGEDGILRIKINEGAVLGLSQVKLQMETIRRICGDKKIPVMVDARLNHTTTTEAKEYAAQNVGNRIATAVVSSNPINNISVNLYITLFRPVTPYKLFANEEKALGWLHEQMEK